MPGTLDGGKKTAKTNKEKYGKNYYKLIGARGGSVKNALKGFGGNHELAVRAGTLGGSISKRNYKTKLSGEYESQDIRLTSDNQ